MTENSSGRSQPGNSDVPSMVGRLGVDGFWMRDYGRGVRVGRPVGLPPETGEQPSLSSGLSDAPWLNRRRPGSLYSIIEYE